MSEHSTPPSCLTKRNYFALLLIASFSFFRTIEYSHIRPIRLYRSSALWLQAVEINVPSGMQVAYIPGVGDLSAPVERQKAAFLRVFQACEPMNTGVTSYWIYSNNGSPNGPKGAPGSLTVRTRPGLSWPR